MRMTEYLEEKMWNWEKLSFLKRKESDAKILAAPLS